MTAFPSLFASGHNCHSTLVSILALESVPKVPSEPEPLPGLMCQGLGPSLFIPEGNPNLAVGSFCQFFRVTSEITSSGNQLGEDDGDFSNENQGTLQSNTLQSVGLVQRD